MHFAEAEQNGHGGSSEESPISAQLKNSDDGVTKYRSSSFTKPSISKENIAAGRKRANDVRPTAFRKEALIEEGKKSREKRER